MNILGIIISTNSTAALFIKDRIVACASEERFTRRKNTNAYPSSAIEFCMKQAGITPEELDIVAFAGNKFNSKYWQVDHDASFSVKDKIREQYSYWYPRMYQDQDPDFLDLFREKILPERKALIGEDKDYDPRIDLAKSHLGIDDKKIHFYNHHDCHAYYAYFAGPRRRDDILNFVIEAFGDDANASISEFNNGKLSYHYRTDDCYIGRLYRHITLLLGMKSNEHEFKVMGLAPYAKEEHYREALDVFNSYMYVDGTEFRYKKRPGDLFFEFKKALEHIRFDNIAGALQKYVEVLLSEWVSNAVKKTGKKSIIFSGGVAMNVKAMMEIAKLDCVEDLYVPSTASDESLAMGVCYNAYKTHAGKESPVCLADVYLGNDITPDDASEFIDGNDIKDEFKVIYDVSPRTIADLLMRGYVTARAVGRMEFGARALGNRSILADPRDPSIVPRINDKIKRRDFWMPFAPVILEDRADDYLKNPKKVSAPHMTIGFETTQTARKDLPAALHPADFTARPQIISEQDNGPYYAIIKAFEKVTGVGALLNTSFNLHGEPIVSDCADALYVFRNSDIDVLILGGHALLKPGIDLS